MKSHHTSEVHRYNNRVGQASHFDYVINSAYLDLSVPAPSSFPTLESTVATSLCHVETDIKSILLATISVPVSALILALSLYMTQGQVIRFRAPAGV